MVNIKSNVAAGTQAQSYSLSELIRQGSLVPMISGEVLNDLVLGGNSAIVAAYAKEVGYPLADSNAVHKIAKYQSLTHGWKDQKLKQDYLDQVAGYVLEMARGNGTSPDEIEEVLAEAEGLTTSTFARRLHFPPLSKDPDDPLQILSNLRLPVYVTTSPFTFIEMALQNSGKYPRSEMCRWHTGLDSVPSVFNNAGWSDNEPECEHNKRDGVYNPCAHKPLVFHLYGVDEYPDSLVLTEDDYLKLLMAVSQGRGKDQGVDPVHSVVKSKLISSALLLVGFSLASWSFRGLYWGLINTDTVPQTTTKTTTTTTTYQRYCCLQLVPSVQEKQYLESYLRQAASFDEVYWEDDVPGFIRRVLKPALGKRMTS